MKQLTIFFSLLLTLSAITHSRPAQAAVGTGGGAVIAGLALAGGGLYSIRKCNNLGCLDIGAMMMLAGIIILEGEQEIGFRELSPDEATKLGVSASELETYNDEVDQANMLVSDVASELSEFENPSAQDSATIWNSVKDFVSPATYKVMQKIASQN